MHRLRIGKALALALRRLRQDQIGNELRVPLRADEVDWLDADLN